MFFANYFIILQLTMIPAKKNAVFNKFFGIYLNRLLKNHFYRINLNGKEKLGQITPGYPTILYANHSSWWDGFIGYFLTSTLWQKEDYLMMDIDQLKKYKMFKYLGVFSVDQHNAAEAVKTINYAASLLKNTQRFLWMFPQGGIEPQGKRPIEFFHGITKLAEKIGQVNLLPAAFRIEFLLEQRPEIFIRIGEPVIFEGNTAAGKNLTALLRDKLVNEMDTLNSDIANNKLDNYQVVFKGKSSRNTTIDKITGK